MTYNELKTRFTELLNRKGRGSIKAKDILSLIIELIDKILGIDVSATATIRKSYDTLALANDEKNPIDPETGKPLKIGQLISVTADPDIANNAIYRLASISDDGTPTWERLAPLGDMSLYAKHGGSTKTLQEIDNDMALLHSDISEVLRLNSIVNAQDIVWGEYVNRIGMFSTSIGLDVYGRTAYIQVYEGATIRYTGEFGMASTSLAIYDSSKRMIAVYPSSNEVVTELEVELPAGAVYLAATIKQSALDRFRIMLKSGSPSVNTMMLEESYCANGKVAYDDNGNAISYPVAWSNGDTGVFSANSYNANSLAYAGYEVTNTQRGLKLVQPSVTFDENGVVTTYPKLKIEVI